MCVQRPPVVETDEEVFAVGIGTDGDGAREVDADQMLITSHGPFDHSTVEPIGDRVGKPPERVTLWHRVPSGRSCRERHGARTETGERRRDRPPTQVVVGQPALADAGDHTSERHAPRQFGVYFGDEVGALEIAHH